ncbi:alpha/beta hydrolase [Patulibacter minatonensis]|uniref:alpha/beta hydrolase n=1 Tax=Patulibacter minatonensis TaxID=298163 RepID=UPI0004B5E1DE|nr:alpha/beta hydrolase [Patulibacter minatonensis]
MRRPSSVLRALPVRRGVAVTTARRAVRPRLAGRAAALLLPLTAAGVVVPTAGAAPRVTLDGGTVASLPVCGRTAPVHRVDTGGALRLVAPAARSRAARTARKGSAVVVDRCENGVWKPLRTITLGARRRALSAGIVTGTEATGDLRVRSRTKAGRTGTPVYARIGVGEIVDVPISVKVVNQNRTAIPCLGAPDGKTYTVRGSVVAPRSALTAGNPAVSVYVHGLGYSSFFFRFGDVPGYDYGLSQARAGHASVVLDRLGNPAHDDLPDGNATCIPAQADMVDQVVRGLRTGRVSGIPETPRFKKVVLAGHSLGGFIAQVAQYSFGSGDALAVIGYTDVPSGLALGTFANAGADCALNPQRSHGATGAPGYAAFGRTDADFAAGHFHDIDPVVARDVLRRHNLDPCGDLLSALQALAVDQVATRTSITAPVLVISGADDALFSPPTNRIQASTAYPRSREVSSVELPDTGHAVTLGRTHEAFRRAMDRWLTDQGA